MTILELWHGSHEKGLESIVPNRSSLPTIFASSSIVVAALFTSYPRKFSFLVDQINSRVYIPDINDLMVNDNGGSVYQVVGDFTPASDKLIYEFEAHKATVKKEIRIDSALTFIMSLNYKIYADSAIHKWAYFYQQDHDGLYPKSIPTNINPISI